MIKKIFVIIIGMLLSGKTVRACDICGCGAGNNYIGILPEFQSKIAGVRYRYNSMKSHVGVGGANTYLTTHEAFHIAEFWGAVHIGQSFRVMLNVPYSFNTKTNQGITERKNGLSDISVYGFYKLFSKTRSVSGKNETSKLFIHTLWAGTGVQLPTGAYDNSEKGTNGNNANLFQLGTGSTDVFFQLMYDMRLQDIGLNVHTQYKINTSNRYDYRYGNKWNLSTQLYYKLRANKQLLFSPNIGLQYESSANDRDEETIVFASGGHILSGTLGVESIFGKMAIGTNYQVPFTQRMANGIVRSNNRFMIHCSLLF